MKTIGITNLGKELDWEKIIDSEIDIPEEGSYYMRKEKDKKYVEPFLSLFEGCNEKAQIVLISSPGAVGKTAFSNYLSAKYKIPVLDLANYSAVGDSTMTGLLADTYPDLKYIKEKLKDGRMTILIDALDEGLLKVSVAGFNAFLNDIIKLTKATDETSTPFIMTGRPGVMMETAQYLERYGIRYVWYQIEPFTISQAKEFIDKAVDPPFEFRKTYNEARDLICESIECFFKKQGDAENKSFKNFIGYAPVLIAIAKVFEKSKNYFEVISKLKTDNYKNTELVISMVKYILTREREQKVIPELILPLLECRNDEFKNNILTTIYSEEEQCARIMYSVLGYPFENSNIQDKAFNQEYQKKIESFAAEHPFLEDGRIQNVVFESYIISKLSKSPEYSWIVNEYLKSQYFKNSFALYPIFLQYYKNNAESDRSSSNLIIPLASSFSSMSSKQANCEVILVGENTEEGVTSGISVDFIYEPNEKKDFDKHVIEESISFHFDNNSSFQVYGNITNTSIIGDFDVVATGSQVNLEGNITIDCRNFILKSEELIVSGDISLIAGDEIIVQPLRDKYPRIIKTNGNLNVNSLLKPEYPLSEYYSIAGDAPEEIAYNPKIFQKLRRLLLLFRCDSKGKGNWARLKDKIDSRFQRGLGKDVLDYMISSGIIYSSGFMYFINVPLMEKKLSVKFDHLRDCRPSRNMVQFMTEMEKRLEQT